MPRLAGLVLSLALPAQAQTASTNQQALAEAMFREARELMQAERYSEACAKFQESQRLDPGGGTLLNLAVCHEAEGKTASAWAEFQEALSVARSDGRADRVELAMQRIEALEPRLSKITIQVDGDPPDGLTVSINGMNVGAAVWGSEVPVDPGKLELRAEAPEHQPFVKTVEIEESEKLEVTVPGLKRAAQSSRTANGGTDGGTATPSNSKTTAYIVGGVGLAAIGAGSYFGVRALQESEKADNNGCDASECTTTVGHDADRNAVFNGWLSTAGFAAGFVALGVATYLYLDGDDGGEASPAMAADSGARARRYVLVPEVAESGVGLSLSGTF